MVAHLLNALTAALVSGRGLMSTPRMRSADAMALATPFTFDGRSSTSSPYDNTNFMRYGASPNYSPVSMATSMYGGGMGMGMGMGGMYGRYGSSPMYSPVSMATSMYGGGGMVNSMYNSG